jgi:DNA-binding transcriptional LysR family regulator
VHHSAAQSVLKNGAVFAKWRLSGDFEYHLSEIKMSDRFQELKVFVRAAETASFSAAGRELGLSQPSISRIISELESRLNTRLLLRSTRRIVPTEAGQVFLQKARQILFDLEEADHVAMGMDSLKGVLRVALPSILAGRIVIPQLPKFLAIHPELKLELLTLDRMHDLVAEGADMAIRFGELEDSSFGFRRLAIEHRLLVASPSFLDALGTPQHPSDLVNFHCIAGPGGSASPGWNFSRDGVSTVVKMSPRIRVASAEAALASACSGLGLTIASAWICEAELDSGQLISVLPDWSLDSIQVNAVYPAGRVPSQKVRLFTEFLSDVMQSL